MQHLGFDRYHDTLRVFLDKYREQLKGDDGGKRDSKRHRKVRRPSGGCGMTRPRRRPKTTPKTRAPPPPPAPRSRPRRRRSRVRRQRPRAARSPPSTDPRWTSRCRRRRFRPRKRPRPAASASSVVEWPSYRPPPGPRRGTGGDPRWMRRVLTRMTCDRQGAGVDFVFVLGSGGGSASGLR